ncbi:hypothetical protein NBRC111894_4591 [Sporolactobacillus inulinus]|uniref:Uncharacterized protein n=1 Tax=Sporolactobacillus inulinus TaxID=2078 RepID=A0A4Y1ZIR1_9BACL|nr:hypothetical protein NBRC111894_4591 [Sporolactobacillus inulinus]
MELKTIDSDRPFGYHCCMKNKDKNKITNDSSCSSKSDFNE